MRFGYSLRNLDFVKMGTNSRASNILSDGDMERSPDFTLLPKKEKVHNRKAKGQHILCRSPTTLTKLPADILSRIIRFLPAFSSHPTYVEGDIKYLLRAIPTHKTVSAIFDKSVVHLVLVSFERKLFNCKDIFEFNKFWRHQSKINPLLVEHAQNYLEEFYWIKHVRFVRSITAFELLLSAFPNLTTDCQMRVLEQAYFEQMQACPCLSHNGKKDGQLVSKEERVWIEQERNRLLISQGNPPEIIQTPWGYRSLCFHHSF